MAREHLTSTAVFLEHAKECGLIYAERNQIEKRKWNTISTFAFTITPGTDGAAAHGMVDKVTSLIIQSTDEEAMFERAPLVRKLWTDCYQLASVQFRSANERRDSDPPVKLGAQELVARVKSQKNRMPDLTWDRNISVGPAFLDKVIDMLERNKLKWLPCGECTSSEQEADGIKVDPTWRIDEHGAFKCIHHADAASADTEDLLDLRYTLQRRALAFDLARICRYELLEQWNTRLFAALKRKPYEGQGKVTVEQIHTADRALFRWMREQTECGGLRADAGTRPFETHITKVLENRIDEVTSILTNRPLAVSAEGRIAAHSQGNKREREPDDPGYGAREAKMMRQLDGESVTHQGA